MAEAQLPSHSYLGYALKDQHNLVGLFGAACFSLGFASALPLLVGGGAELLWLLVGPRLPVFRDWVDRQRSNQYLARAETAIETALEQLNERDANRYRAVSRVASELLASAQEQLPARTGELAVQALLELRRTFLDYLFLGQRVEALLDATPNAELEREAAELRAAYGGERELTVRMTIRKALASMQRRISQQAALGGVSRNVELRLEMLEKVLPSLGARLKDRGLEQLAPEVDSALSEIGAADPLELALDEIFEQPPASGV